VAGRRVPDVKIERLFGPETLQASGIPDRTGGCDLHLAWYGGDGEYAPGTGLAHDPFYSVGNPVIWQAPDGVVWLWYVVRPGPTWSTSRIAMKVSRDGARTWSDASMLTFEEGTMVRGKPIVLINGGYLLSVWKETGFDAEVVAADTASFFLRYDPRARKWSESSRIHSRLGALQPAVAQIDETYLVAYCRRGGKYGARTDGYMIRTESRVALGRWGERCGLH